MIAKKVLSASSFFSKEPTFGRRGIEGVVSFTLLLSILSYIQPVFSIDITHTKSNKTYSRIIALSPHAVEMLFSIDAGHLIIGTVEFADFPLEAKKIPRLGSYSGIQMEKILALKPDLIIAWKNGNKQSDLQRLDSFGFELFYSNPKNINEISDELIKLGKLTGLDNNAKTISESITLKHKQIINHYAKKSKIKVFYQLWFDPLRTVGSNSWLESLIMDCNGINLYNDTESSYPIVSLESILVRNPQVIIIPSHSDKKMTSSNLWDKWTMIDAVKNKHIFQLNGDLLHRFGPRSLKGLEKLCSVIDKARD